MLAIDRLTYRIDGRLLFEEASATIPAGWRVGFVGRNGSGKTTLFRLIAGEAEAEDGTVTVARRARIGRVAQEAPAGPISLIETVLQADTERAALMAERETATEPHRIAEIETRLADIGAHAAPARAAAILAGLGFPAGAQTRPCAEFSGGWRMRVALAAVLFAEPDLLLLDEPTNYLDLEGALWLETYLASYPHTVVLISHDRELLNRAAGAILHLENRKLTLYQGNYDIFARTRAARRALAAADAAKRAARRAHYQAFVDRFRYKASKARQAQSRLKMIERLGPIEPVVDETSQPFILPPPVEAAPPLVTMERASVGYDGRIVLGGLNLRIDPDDRIALLGANGNGKSTLVKLIAGRLKPMSGGIARARRLRVGYFAQHQLDELVASETAVEHLSRALPLLGEVTVRTRLGGFGFGAERADTPAGALSGGEKARLLLALATVEAPNLLILDEPTNHLDIDARAALIEALNDYGGAVILVSHDASLIEATCDRLMLVADGRVTPFDGDIADYRRLALEAARAGAGTARSARETGETDTQTSRADQRRAAAAIRAELAPLKKAADRAEAEIAKLTAEIARHDAALGDPALYRREPEHAAALQKARGQLARRLEAAEAAWLEAAETYEAARAGAGA